MKKYAVVVAGGSGSRMGSSVPKQFLLLNGKPVLLYTIETFLSAYNDLEVILVLPTAFIEEGMKLIKQSKTLQRITVAGGGETRFHSVKNGLAFIRESSVIFVHDGVRCLVSKNLIHSCYELALEKGIAIPCVPVTDSVRVINGNTNKPIDRNLLRAVQTPQTFQSSILLKAFEQSYREAFTDEATVAEAAGYEIFLTEGEKENIKITLPADILLAQQILEKRGDLNNS